MLNSIKMNSETGDPPLLLSNHWVVELNPNASVCFVNDMQICMVGLSISVQHVFGINHGTTFVPADVGVHRSVENYSEIGISEKRSRCLC